MFKFRKLADYSDGSVRVRRYDPLTGDPYLVNPVTNQMEPWPLLGVTVEGEVPTLDRISADYVARAVVEGWAEWFGHRMEHKPGGPPEDPWLVTHTFHQADKIVFHVLLPDKGQWAEGTTLVKRDLVYSVVSQPGKHEDASEPSGWRIDWTFQLELVSIDG
jgi:hypothetical protein